MDWGDTAEQAAFRAEVRAFVEARLPERYRNDPFDRVTSRKLVSQYTILINC